MPSLNKLSQISLFLCLSSLVLFGFACSGGGGTGSGTNGGSISLQGAGATFPNPIYQKWLSEYGKLHPNVKIDYQSIGSGGGIKQIQAQTVDLGAWVGPLSKAAWKAAQDNSFIIRMVWGPLALPITLR